MVKDIRELVNDITNNLKETVDGLHFNDEVETIPTGIDLFDSILGGGFPIGKIVLLTGSPGGGKSTLAANAIGSLHRQYENAIAFYLDAEQSMTKKRLSQLGADPERTILISQDLTVEKISDIIVKIVSWKKSQRSKIVEDIPMFIVWDSESATMTEKQLDASDPSKVLGQKAQMLSLMIPRLANIANKERMSFLIIGQLRDKVDLNPYAPKGGDLRGLGDKKITGGNVMKYHPFQIIHVKPKEEIDPAAYGFAGTVSEVKVIKNKLFTPNIKIDIVLDYMKGYSDFYTKERLIRNCKGIVGTRHQNLKGLPEIKFTKKTIKEVYDTNEEFRKKFEELYMQYKSEISAIPNATDMIINSKKSEEETEIDDKDKEAQTIFEALDSLANSKEDDVDD